MIAISGWTGAAIAVLMFTAPVAAQDAADTEIKDTLARKAQAEADTQEAVRDKARSDAKKAASDAAAAAAAAKFGTLSGYQTPGTTEVGANSGKLEATLLASEATTISAAHIVGRLCKTLIVPGEISACGSSTPKSKRLLVYGDAEKPQFDAYDAYTSQERSIRAHLLRVKVLKPVEPSGGPISTSAMGPAAIGTAVNILGNLFRSDYKLSAIDVTQDDALFVKAFVGQALARDLNALIVAPSVYVGRIDFDTNSAIKSLESLEQLRDQVARNATGFRRQAARPKDKAPIDAAVAEMDEAVKRFDTFVLKLSTPTDNGSVPFVTVARQAMIADALGANSYILILKANMAGGSAYSKKNFWTFLGELPFSVSGGSLVSFTLIKGDTGNILDAGILQQTRPFMKIHAATRQYLHGVK